MPGEKPAAKAYWWVLDWLGVTFRVIPLVLIAVFLGFWLNQVAMTWAAEAERDAAIEASTRAEKERERAFAEIELLRNDRNTIAKGKQGAEADRDAAVAVADALKLQRNAAIDRAGRQRQKLIEELTRFEGRWRIKEISRRVATEKHIIAKDEIWVFKDGKLEIELEQGSSVFAVSVDPSKKPCLMDLRINDDLNMGRFTDLTKCIYEFRGNDTITFCFFQGLRARKERPTEFRFTKKLPVSKKDIRIEFVLERLKAGDVTGTWTSRVQGRNAPASETTFKLKQDGTYLSGTVVSGGMEVKIEKGKVEDGKVFFQVTREFKGNKFVSKYMGTVDGDTVKGTHQVTISDSKVHKVIRILGKASWLAKRQK